MPTNERNPPSSASPDRRLAEARLAAGLTQIALARQIGVSRQFLNQLESGRVLPNVAVALRLASLLGRSVEALFADAAGAADESLPVVAVPADQPVDGRLRLGRVGRLWIAHPADTAGSLAAGFAPADAVLLAGGRARLLVPPAAAAANLLLAGCDPALALLRLAADGEPAGRCHWFDCGSGRALDLLAAGHVHVAGIHYGGSDGAGNIEEVNRRDPARHWAVVRFTRWDQGWLVRPGTARNFRGVTSLGTRKWVLANRDASSAARRWLDAELAKARISPDTVCGYADCVGSAADGARAVAMRRADVTIGPRAVAAAHGLEFVPAEAVDFDLVAPATWWRSAAGIALIRQIDALTASHGLAGLPGYATTRAGTFRPRRAASPSTRVSRPRRALRSTT